MIKKGVLKISLYFVILHTAGFVMKQIILAPNL